MSISLTLYGSRRAAPLATSSSAISNPIQQFPNCDCIVLTSSTFAMEIIIIFFSPQYCVCASVYLWAMCKIVENCLHSSIYGLQIVCKSIDDTAADNDDDDVSICFSRSPRRTVISSTFLFNFFFHFAIPFLYKSELYGLIQISYCNAWIFGQFSI